MFNVLMVEQNAEYATELINAITQSEKRIRIHTIASNSRQALDTLARFEIDIILLDLRKEENKHFIKHIYQSSYEKYKESIIVIASGLDEIMEIVNHPFVYGYLVKPFEKKELLKKVDELVSIKEKEKDEIIVREKIIKELTYLRYNFSYHGTRYLSDTILTLFKRKNYYCDNLKNDIYPIVAQKYGKSVNNIKCNILSATNNMFCECETEKIKRYFCTTDKPKPKTVIYTILNRL